MNTHPVNRRTHCIAGILGAILLAAGASSYGAAVDADNSARPSQARAARTARADGAIGASHRQAAAAGQPSALAVPNALLPAPAPFDFRKNRYITFGSNNADEIMIQVQVIPLACDISGKVCSYDEDCPDFATGERCLTSLGNDPADPDPAIDAEWETIGWVGPPCEITPDTQVPADTYASLVVFDMPPVPGYFYVDSGTGDPLSTVFVTDCEIMPRFTYGLRASLEGSTFTTRLIIGTILRPYKNNKNWADVVGYRDPGTGEYTEPNERINIDDVVAIIYFLINKSYRPHITVVDLSHEVTNFRINADDLQMVLRAFNIGENYPPYKFIVEASGAAHPRDCPIDPPGMTHSRCVGGVSVCGNGVLEVGEECDDGNTLPGDGCSDYCRSEGDLVLEWVPVGSSGAYTIDGNEIIVPAGGVEVTMELRISNWDPDMTGQPLLGAFNAALDGASLLGANAVPGSPGADLITSTQLPCSNGDSDCPTGFCGAFEREMCDDNQAAYIVNKVCYPTTAQHCGWIAHCPAGEFCIDNPEFVLSGTNASATVALSSPARDWEWIGVASFRGKTDPGDGTKFYAGSLRFEVPVAAFGTYTLNWSTDADGTFVNDFDGLRIPGLVFVPGHVTVGLGEPCCHGGACSVLSEVYCAILGGVPVSECLGDGNGDGLDDACEGDCDGDGIRDGDETNPADQDCDTDGTCNSEEIANCPPGDPSCDDCHSNGIPDGCDLRDGTSLDCTENGVPDTCDIVEKTSPDCNTNWTPDECEIDVNSTAGGGPYFCTFNCDRDCGNNGVPDACDIAADPNLDCDDNGVLDECETWACCLDDDQDGIYELCADDLPEACALAGGIFRGPCHYCPEQNAAIIPEPGGGVFVHVIGAPIDCLAETGGGLRRSCTPGAPKIDPWKSDADAQMCHNFGVTDSPAIPAGFFCPLSDPTCGSDEWAGNICLEGVSLGDPLFPDADTLISRSADPFDRCDLAALNTTAAPVEIEVIALSLESVGPISVTYDGQNPEPWNVAVDLSTFVTDPPLPLGTLTATKTHCNGGTYTSVLHVQPRFTFTKVGSNPPEVRILDTGEEGIPYVTLDQQDPVSWVADIDPDFGVTGDPCSDFHAGIDDMVHVSDCDCNGNQVRDGCDIEFDRPDCNQNAVPDECEIDGNSPASGGPFFCTTDCDPDCNVNGVPDQCDLAPPEAAPAPYDMRKNRVLSFSPGDNGCVAIRVELLDRACRASGEACTYDADCPEGETCEDQSNPAPIGWVGEPCQIPADTQVPPGTMTSLVVREMPAPRVFPDMVFVTDCEIQPRRGYALSATTDGIVFSERFVIATIREPFKNAKHWADVVGQRDPGTGEYTEPNQRINVDDVSVMIVFVNNKDYRPHLTVVDLSHEVVNYKINADDLSMVLRAFNITEDYPPLKFQIEASGAAHPWHCPHDSADARHGKCE